MKPPRRQQKRRWAARADAAWWRCLAAGATWHASKWRGSIHSGITRNCLKLTCRAQPRSAEIARDQGGPSEGPVPRRRLRSRGRRHASQGRRAAGLTSTSTSSRPAASSRRYECVVETSHRLPRVRGWHVGAAVVHAQRGGRAGLGASGQGPSESAAARCGRREPRRARSLAPRRPCGHGRCLPVPLSASSPPAAAARASSARPAPSAARRNGRAGRAAATRPLAVAEHKWSTRHLGRQPRRAAEATASLQAAKVVLRAA